MPAAFAHLRPGRTAVVAHRGAGAHAPENTIAAFRLAAEQGADGVELDVRRTGDGVLVVSHDPGHPAVGPLVERPFGMIRDAAPDVPTLDEALAACAGMWVNVEIKNSPAEPDFDPDDMVAARVAALVSHDRLRPRVIVSSFNLATLAAVRRAAPDVATGVLCGVGLDPRDALAMAVDGGHAAIHPVAASMPDGAAADLVRDADRAAVRVMTWTVNDPDEVRRFAGAGVHGVITDDPAMAVAALRG